MSNIKDTQQESEYWSLRYAESRTGWDIGHPSTPIKTYIDQLEDKGIKILIPGAGNAYEAEYLHQRGFKNTFILDISAAPLNDFQKRNPDFSAAQLIQDNFFTHQGAYDLIFEQTFFCSFPPTDENRNAYVKQMSQLLVPNGKLVGLWFDIPLTGDMEKRPFGGSRDMYLKYLASEFKMHTFDHCHNSIEPRQGNELFGIFKKK